MKFLPALLFLAASLPGAIVRGPYLEAGSSSAMTLRWRTDVSSCSDVWIGPVQGALDFVPSTPDSVTDHVRRVTGLAAASTYFYALGCSGSAITGDDANHSFLTAPGSGPTQSLRIWALGDSGTGDANAIAVRDAYLAFTGSQRTDLWLQLGDSAYESGTDAEFQAGLFDIYPSLLRSSSLYPAIGNHETYSPSPAFFSIHSLPASPQSPAYSFDYGQVHFICLDSMTQSRLAGGPMAAWLQSDLSLNAGAAWTIAYFHHPPYSKGSHDSDSEIELMEMRQHIIPILEQWGVDLVLSGHSHAYERSHLLRGHYGASSTFLSDLHVLDPGPGIYTKQRPLYGGQTFLGTVYVVAGSSAKLSPGSLNHPALPMTRYERGSLVIDVHANSLQARFLNSAGAVSDNFILKKDLSAGAAVPMAKGRLKTYPQPLRGNLPLRVIVEDPEHGRAAVSLDLFTLSGEQVLRLKPECACSPTPFVWRAKGLPGGLYLAVAKDESGGVIASGKISLIQ